MRKEHFHDLLTAELCRKKKNSPKFEKKLNKLEECEAYVVIRHKDTQDIFPISNALLT